MSLSLIIFLLAVFGVVAIIILRFYEFHFERLLISKDLRMNIERRMITFYKEFIHVVIYLSRKFKNFMVNLPSTTAHLMHFYWRKLSKKVDKFFMNMRNKK